MIKNVQFKILWNHVYIPFSFHLIKYYQIIIISLVRLRSFFFIRWREGELEREGDRGFKRASVLKYGSKENLIDQ